MFPEYTLKMSHIVYYELFFKPNFLPLPRYWGLKSSFHTPRREDHHVAENNPGYQESISEPTFMWLFPNSILPILNSSWPTHDNLLSSWTKFLVFYWSRIYTFPIHSNSLSPQILDHCVSLSCACLTPHRPFCPCSALSLSTTQPIQIYMWGMIYNEEYLI